MDVERVAEELTERKVVRRGLITAIAALGAAALVKVSGTGRAEAAHDDDDVGLGLNNPTGAFPTPTTTTLITASVAANPGFQVINGGSAASGKSGIVGVSDAIGGGGVRGYNDTAGGFGVGGNSANGEGVQGVSNSSAVNSGFGVRGVNTANGTGIKGVSNTGGNTSADGNGSGTGVIGKSNSGVGVQGDSGSNIGVRGTSSSSMGVWGSSTSVAGVYGSTLTGTGVLAEAASSSGLGIRGVNTSNGTAIKGVSNTGLNSQADGSGTGIGVHGKSGSGAGVQGDSTTGIGVIGNGGNIGLVGIGTTGAGMWGQSTSYIGVVGSSVGVATAIYGFSTSNGFGVHGESQSSAGVMAVAKTANAPGLFAQNTTVGAGKLAAFFDGNIFIQGSYTATGAKLAIVPHPDGSMRSLYCTEATEPLFEDYGRAQLVGGVARVRIDPDFAPLVHRTAYHVFTEAEGDCRGLFVSQQDVNSFEIRELQGGKSSVPFSYRIVAKRVDIVGERLKRVSPDVMNAVRAQANAAANAPRPAGPLNPSSLNGPGGGQPGRQTR